MQPVAEFTGPPAPPDPQRGPAPLRRLLRTEWTKFLTVRGWVITAAVAALMLAGVGLWAAGGPSTGCQPVVNGAPVAGAGFAPCPTRIPIGPGGEAVTDTYFFAGQPLRGDGSITTEVTSLTGAFSAAGGTAGPGQSVPLDPGLQPWSKAGIIIAASSRPGSAYAAVVATGAHGVRMQWNYTGDVAGLTGPVSAAAPRWLRLTRAADRLTGFDSADGAHWTRIGSVVLAGLQAQAQAGLAVTSPQRLTAETAVPTEATAEFARVSLTAGNPLTRWSGRQIGARGQYGTLPGRLDRVGDQLRLTGSGDIAPAVAGPMNLGRAADGGLAGAFPGLIVLIVLGTLIVTTEYRRGLIRTTLTAAPWRGRVLASKAAVTAAVSAAAGLTGAAVTVLAGPALLRAHGNVVLPAAVLTTVRVVAGTAALLALAALLAFSAAVITRRAAGPVAAVVGLLVVPYVFAGPMAVLPAGVADWLLRVTPAAGFAIEQMTPRYPQVADIYTAQYGYYPLPPWAGLAVTAAWTVAALGLAAVLFRRRDA